MDYGHIGKLPSNTQIKIYHGDRIGGCVTVISYDNGDTVSRIMIDYGENLSGSESEDFFYPWEDEPVNAVFFSHYHADHAGRLAEIPKNVPVYMGSAAKEVMRNIHTALAGTRQEGIQHRQIAETLNDPERVRTFAWDGRCYKSVTDIPGFTVAAFSVDHSAYDAYMFLIETPDKKILHTGDFRGHGRRGKAILPMIRKYVRQNGTRDIDILITEGTLMTRKGENVLKETKLQKEAEQLLQRRRHAFLICSSTNLDSLVSFIKAAESNGIRTYCYSRYLCTQLKTFSDTAGKFSDVYKFENIYPLELQKQLSSQFWDRAHSQEELMREKGFLAIIKAEDFCEKYLDAFRDLNPVIIYSMWNGYIDPENKACNAAWYEFLGRQKAGGIDVIQLHTSGHATPEFISEVIKAIDPKEAVIPIHTEFMKGFLELDISDELKRRIII